MTKLTFCMQVSMKTYCILILWFWRRWSSISKVSKIASLQCLYNVSNKKIEMKLIFCMQMSIKVDFNTLGTKVRYKVMLWLLISIMKHFQITLNINFANPCNVSKKLGMEFIFCMQTKTNVSKNWHYCFWWRQQIRRLVIFLQYIKEKVFWFLTTAFVFYCDVKH